LQQKRGREGKELKRKRGKGRGRGGMRETFFFHLSTLTLFYGIYPAGGYEKREGGKKERLFSSLRLFFTWLASLTYRKRRKKKGTKRKKKEGRRERRLLLAHL